jgi:hypothetical protein
VFVMESDAQGCAAAAAVQHARATAMEVRLW